MYIYISNVNELEYKYMRAGIVIYIYPKFPNV